MGESNEYELRNGWYVSKDGKWFWSGDKWLPVQEPPRKRLNPLLKFFLAWPVFWITSVTIALVEGTINGWIGSNSLPSILAFVGGFIAVIMFWRRF